MTSRTGDEVLPMPAVRLTDLETRRRLTVVLLAALALLPATGTAGAAQSPAKPNKAPGRLTVVAESQPTSCFVGQAVVLSVGVAAERERPSVTPPKVDGADVELVRTDQVPMSAGGIGNAVWEKNLFRFVYRLVPRRSGTLTVPSVLAKLGERTGRSQPLRLVVRDLPAADRPSAFLGGVGRFEVEARAEPASLRTGQTLEYRVTVSGPAARGVTGSPSVDRLASVPLGLGFERLPDARTADPPSHTFVYRLRPTRAGEATLPPVAVAAFDPAAERYVTKVTPGVRIKVSDVPAFDPSVLSYGTAATGSGSATVRTGTLAALSAAAATLLTASVLVVVGVRQRSLGRGTRMLSRWLAAAEAQLAESADDGEAGRALTESLASFLSLTTGRPPGALTPAEAAEGVARATGSVERSRESEQLVTRCDRAQFGGPASVDGGFDLRLEGKMLLRALAAANIPATNGQGREGQGTPRGETGSGPLAKSQPPESRA